jgi:hypothetical protein
MANETLTPHSQAKLIPTRNCSKLIAELAYGKGNDLRCGVVKATTNRLVYFISGYNRITSNSLFQGGVSAYLNPCNHNSLSLCLQFESRVKSRCDLCSLRVSHLPRYSLGFLLPRRGHFYQHSLS